MNPNVADKIKIGVLEHIHDGFDCSTFTKMAQDRHARHPSNGFMGTSAMALESNLRFHFKTAFYCEDSPFLLAVCSAHPD